MLVIAKRVEEAERAVKWEQDAKAFLDHVMAMTVGWTLRGLWSCRMLMLLAIGVLESTG